MIDLKAKTEARQRFEESLRKRVVGQDEAVEQVSEAFEIINADMVDIHKPLCNMLFLGPTGVGKTLLVEAVAEALHGSRDCMTAINCAEYSEDHQIARIIGAPPGYIGHDTTEPVICPANLTKGWVDKGPRISILLFDEVEKASPKLHQLMLGIMAKAEMQDGKNRTLDLNRCMIFMTSNVGSRAINQEHIGFKKHDFEAEFNAISAEAINAAKKKFDPEFMGRITNTVVFRALTVKELNGILDKELWMVYERALSAMLKRPEFGSTTKGIFQLGLTDRMREFLLAGTEKKHGARNITKAVNDHVAKKIATIIATQQVTKPGFVVFDYNDGLVSASYTEVTDPTPELLEGKDYIPVGGA